MAVDRGVSLSRFVALLLERASRWKRMVDHHGVRRSEISNTYRRVLVIPRPITWGRSIPQLSN